MVWCLRILSIAQIEDRGWLTNFQCSSIFFYLRYFIINFCYFFFVVEIDYERSKREKLNQFTALLLKSILHSCGSKLQISLLYATFIVLLCTAILTGRTKYVDNSTPFPFTFNTYRRPIIFYRQSNNLFKNPIVNGTAYQYTRLEAYVNANVNVHFHRIPAKTKIADFLVKLNPSEMSFVNKHFIAGASFKNKFIVVWLNNKAFHTAPLTLNTIHNALLRYVLY